VTGIVLGAMAANKASWLEDQNASGTAEYAGVKDNEADGRKLQAGQIATLAAGGVLAATGVVLLVLDARSPERRAWLSPMIAPGGIVLGGGLRY
jgi:hypothetical protein